MSDEPISLAVVFLTLNEAADLPAAMAAAQDLGSLWVVDSGSTDETIALAQSAGATVLSRPFDGFGTQRNWALEQLSDNADWVLFLDADEFATDAFKQGVLESIATASDDIAGYYCCWKLMLSDRWLKRSDNFPKWQFRLVRRGRARFIDSGHGQKEGEIDGRLDYLREPYLHYAFSKGWTVWLERHNRYASKEAEERRSNRRPLNECFSQHGSIRNRALKYWLTKLPCWPLLRFTYSYVLRGGFLDGRPGFEYCTAMAFYEFMVRLKMRELRSKAIE